MAVKGRKKARKTDKENSASSCSQPVAHYYGQNQPSNRLSCGRRWTVTEDSALREAVEKALAQVSPSKKRAAAAKKKKKSSQSPLSTPSSNKRKRSSSCNDGPEDSVIDWNQIAKVDMEGHERSAGECFNRWERVLKQGLVKGAFSQEEDDMIRQCIEDGVPRWSEIAERIPGRVGKQCRERWYNHLDPSLKHNVSWLPIEDDILSEACEIWGSCWSKICKLLPGRSANMCKNRWNGSCRRKGKGFGSSKKDGPIFYLRCLEDDNEESVLDDLVASDDCSLDDEGMYILESARKAARVLINETPGSGSGDSDGPYTPDGLNGQGGTSSSCDSDLVQVSIDLKARTFTSNRPPASSTATSSRRVTPLPPCPPLPVPSVDPSSSTTPKSKNKRGNKNVAGSRDEFGKRINGKSMKTRRKKDLKKGKRAKLQQQMPKLPSPTIDMDDVSRHLAVAPDAMSSPGSFKLIHHGDDDTTLIHHDDEKEHATSDDGVFVKAEQMQSEKWMIQGSQNVSNYNQGAGKFLCTPKTLPVNVLPHKPLKSPATPALTLLAEVSEKSPPLLEPSHVPSCSVKWVNPHKSTSTSERKCDRRSTTASSSSSFYTPSDDQCDDNDDLSPGPYDAFTPVVCTQDHQQRLKKRLAGTCLGSSSHDTTNATATQLKRSPISVIKVDLPKLSAAFHNSNSSGGFHNKLSVLASTAEAARMLHDEDNANENEEIMSSGEHEPEPGLDEEEMSNNSMKEGTRDDVDGESTTGDEQTPVAQLVSKSFKSNHLVVRTPVLNMSSPSCVHHNDNILSIFKTPEEDKMLLLGGRHDWSSQDDEEFPTSSQGQGMSKTSIGEMLDKPSLVPFTGRDVHATMSGFKIGSSLTLPSKSFTTRGKGIVTEGSQGEDQDDIPSKHAAEKTKIPVLNEIDRQMLRTCRRSVGDSDEDTEYDSDATENDSDEENNRSKQDYQSSRLRGCLKKVPCDKGEKKKMKHDEDTSVGEIDDETSNIDQTPVGRSYGYTSSPTFSFGPSPTISATMYQV